MSPPRIPAFALTADSIRALIESREREGPTLDYKRGAPDLSHDGMVELAKDVSAMANADGGLIIYGIEEDEDAAPGRVPGFDSAGADRLEQRIEQVIRTNIDQPVPNVTVREIPWEGGASLLCIGIPRSPLAPHMVDARTTRPRFYQRTNTANHPIGMSIVKEIALRYGDAEGAAIRLRDERTEAAVRGYPTLLIHFLPLFPQRYAVDAGDPEMRARLRELAAPVLGGGTGRERFSVDGFASGYNDGASGLEVRFLRSGGIEVAHWPMAGRTDAHPSVIPGGHIKNYVARCGQAFTGAQIPGVLPFPVLFSVGLVGIHRARLLWSDNYSLENEKRDLLPDPVLLQDWGEFEQAAGQILDTIWQGFGWPRVDETWASLGE